MEANHRRGRSASVNLIKCNMIQNKNGVTSSQPINLNNSDNHVTDSFCSASQSKKQFSFKSKSVFASTSNSKNLIKPRVIRLSPSTNSNNNSKRKEKRENYDDVADFSENESELIGGKTFESKLCQPVALESPVFLELESSTSPTFPDDNFSAKRRCRLQTTEITTVPDKETPNFQKLCGVYLCRDSETKELPFGFQYCIVLPWIVTIHQTPVNQPIVIIIYEDFFQEIGFSAGFDEDINSSKNNFKLRINDFEFDVKVIAIGRDPISLKSQFEVNIALFFHFSFLRKLFPLYDRVYHLKYSPILEINEPPKRFCLPPEALKRLFNINEEEYFTELKHHTMNLCSEDVEDVLAELNAPISSSKINEKESGQEKLLNLDSQSNVDKMTQQKGKQKLGKMKIKNESKNGKCREKESQNSRKDNLDDESESSHHNSSYKVPSCAVQNYLFQNATQDQLFQDAENLMKELNIRKDSVNDWEPKSAAIRALIELIERIFHIIKFQTTLEAGTHHTVYLIQPDPTKKNTETNRILLEGVLELNLAKYNEVIINFKPKNASSCLYHLVKHAFPESYWKNVCLKLNSREISEKTESKFPLAVVWGYEDPFNRPYDGPCLLLRGEERIKKFIEHCLRRAKSESYTKSDYSSLRVRLSKTLSAINKEYAAKNDNHNNCLDDEEEADETDVELCNDDENFSNENSIDLNNHLNKILNDERGREIVNFCWDNNLI